MPTAEYNFDRLSEKRLFANKHRCPNVGLDTKIEKKGVYMDILSAFGFMISLTILPAAVLVDQVSKNSKYANFVSAGFFSG
jgi:hypothetical protein